MNKPLTTWYCDVCGDTTDVQHGYVVWKNGDGKARDFKIVHKVQCDRDRSYSRSAALEDFLGEVGLSQLLSFLSLGSLKKRLRQGPHCDISDFDEFTDFFRRTQTPYYEEARRHFGNPWSVVSPSARWKRRRQGIQ